MNWTYLLTSIEGRINRQQFWIALICLSVPELAARYAWGERWSSIVSLILAYPNFAVFAKRGHDRNVPTWAPGAPAYAILRARRPSLHPCAHAARRFRIPPRHRRPESLRPRSA